MDQKLQFTYPKASLKKTSKLQKKPSALKREHPALQNMKFFLLFWVILALLEPEPDLLTRLNPDPIRIRIRIRNPASYRNLFNIKDELFNIKNEYTALNLVREHSMRKITKGPVTKKLI